MSLDNTQLQTEDLSPLARTILDRISVLGILDTEHLKDLEIDRTPRDQTLKRLTGDGLIAPIEMKGNFRAGRTGRPPLTFGLTIEGASLARELGQAQAHAYEQTNPVNQAHDICILDIRFAALKASLPLETERNLIATPRVVRPDNLITLPAGSLVLIESEGRADAGQRARVIEKALNWNASVAALKKLKADLRIRVLFNLKSGAALDATFEIWTEAIAAAQSSLGQPLDIQFWGRALPDFLEDPKWDSVSEFIRLDDPSRLKGFGLSPKQQQALAEPFAAIDLLPPSLRQQVAVDEDARLRLRAHGRYVARHLQKDMPHFSAEFFELVRELHGTAFAAEGDERLSLPTVALVMLRTYVLHYPDLQQALFTAHRKFKNASSVLIALRLATKLINTFLDFHGLRHDHPDCRVWINPPDLNGEGGSDFRVGVRLRLKPTSAPDSTSDWYDFRDATSDALEWVLQQLIDYPQIVGIDHSPNESNDKVKSDKRAEQ